MTTFNRKSFPIKLDGKITENNMRIRWTVALMPQLAPVMKSGRITKWFKQPGDYINAHELIFAVKPDQLLEADATKLPELVVESCDPLYLAKIIHSENNAVEHGTPVAILCDEQEHIQHVQSADLSDAKVMIWQAYKS
jgi:hypothetical protein